MRRPYVKPELRELPGVDLDTLERLARDASQSPWRVIRDDTDCGYITYAVIPPNEGATLAWVPEDCNDNARSDAAFIAAANPGAVLELCARVRRLEALLVEALPWVHDAAKNFGPPVAKALERLIRDTVSAEAEREGGQ